MYGYDPLNRLVSVRLKSTNVLQFQYFYDASGERAAAIAYNASGTAAGYTQYLRDGSEVVYEKSWSLPGYTVTLEKAYIGVQGKPAVTKQTVGGTTTYTYYATDHLGTVRATLTVNPSGVEQYRTFHDYEPYGMEIVPLQTSSHTHRYTGHERDVLDALSNTTLDYMHTRYYGSNLGRFMKPDVIFGNPAHPQSWNLYSYVGNNPMRFTDPLGLAPVGADNEDKKKKRPNPFPPLGQDDGSDPTGEDALRRAMQTFANKDATIQQLQEMSVRTSVTRTWHPETVTEQQTDQGTEITVAAGYWTYVSTEVMYASAPRQESMRAIVPPRFHFGYFLYLNSQHLMSLGGPLPLACTGAVIGAVVTSESGPGALGGAGIGATIGFLVGEVKFINDAYYSDSLAPPAEPGKTPPGLGKFTMQPTQQPVP